MIMKRQNITNSKKSSRKWKVN